MNFVFVGMLLGATVTSWHDTREACLGKKAILEEKGVSGSCVEQPSMGSYITNGTSIVPSIRLCSTYTSDGKCWKQ